MIITRTPLRISLAGGGTDIKSYYKLEPGKVINMAIDKYLYVVVKTSQKKKRNLWFLRKIFLNILLIYFL